jgi:hypothetical protein
VRVCATFVGWRGSCYPDDRPAAPLSEPGNQPSGEEGSDIMGSIRRTLGGFTVAVVIAAGLVLLPASVHAKQKTATSSTSICDSLAAYIEYITNTYDGELEAALLKPFQAAWSYYCE